MPRRPLSRSRPLRETSLGFRYVGYGELEGLGAGYPDVIGKLARFFNVHNSIYSDSFILTENALLSAAVSRETPVSVRGEF